MGQLLLDAVEKASPLRGPKPGDFRNRVVIEANRGHRDYNYSPIFQDKQQAEGN